MKKLISAKLKQYVRDDYLKCVPHVDEKLTQAMCLHPHIFIATQVLSIQIY